mmetsp:Transcript_40549/g.95321  ORF Transcript_40549/g.95321 Transcript_40549/m.95321 type:complete len:220 (-) Transcript_40549:487-1146(-)
MVKRNLGHGSKPRDVTTRLKATSSDHLAVEDALEEHGLGSLRAHVGVGGELGDEDAANLVQALVHLVDLHLDGALANVEDLVGLLEELILAFASIGLESCQGHSLVVAGVHTTALGVEEATCAVGWHLVLAAPSEAWLELAAGALGHQLLHGEEERHSLSVGELHSAGGKVDAVLLDEGQAATLVLQGALDLLKGVGLTSHQPGVDKLLAALRLRLHGE